MINLSLQVVYQCLLELTRLHNNNISMTLVVGYPFFVTLTEYIIRGPDTYVNNFPNIALSTLFIKL